MRTISIGNAQGFWGDSLDAPRRLLEQAPALQFLTLDYLAEVSMSIMALQRHRDPDLGYARDFLDVVRDIAPLWKAGHPAKIVCNAGGLNPEACARASLAVLAEAGISGKRVAVILGDNVLEEILGAPDSPLYRHLESDRPIKEVLPDLVTANAYVGARAVAEALDGGADIVLTGRVADPSLAVGVCLHAFGWSDADFDRLAAATVAGHILECGTQACGGIATHWLELPDPAHIGFPIIEMTEDGAFEVTKPEGTGGEVSLRTVSEQLLYELGDPRRYLSPDCTVDFTSIRLESSAKDRVRVTGTHGQKPPETLKVSATYRDGYTAHGTLTVFGRDAVAKAKRCGEIILERLEDAGYVYERSLVECLGANACVQEVLAAPALLETVLRISVASQDKEAVDRFGKELAPLVTSGPQGVTGYAAGRPRTRPVFGYWPCLIERVKAETRVVWVGL